MLHGVHSDEKGITLIEFSLIRAGLIDITPEEGVKDSRPTSSLLRCGGFKMVIDTEHPKEDGTEYVAALRRLGVVPDEVDAVLFTHLHPDHFGHKNLFSRATFLFHRDERLGFYFKNDRTTVLSGDAVLELSQAGIENPEPMAGVPDLRALGNRIYVRHAPGHTPGSVLVFAVVGGLVHAWVGDTFLNEASYADWHPPGSSWDQVRIYEHMDYIRENADIIIPGHGAPFRA